MGAEGSDEEEKEEEEETEEVTTKEWVLVNENKPIWLRPTEEVTKKEYNDFFKAITKEFEEPMEYTHFRIEGEVDFRSILYLPGKAPYNLFDYTQTMSNVRLYVRRVFITDDFKDLLPRYLNFIKGVVDSDDLPLNVSRETLAQSRVLKVMSKKLTRKVLEMLRKIATRSKKGDDDDESSGESDNDDGPTDYDKFWEQ